MKRVVLCVPDPWNYYDQLQEWSVMTVNPDNTPARQKYLLDNSDWSMKITSDGVEHRDGGNYANERLFWYTSGTIGDSKFYSFSQQQLDLLTDAIISDLEISDNDRYVSVMGLWHAHGQSLYWATRRAGCETHFLPVSQIRTMTQFQPTFVSAIPDILWLIGKLPLTHLRFLRSGSAPLSVSYYQDLSHKFRVPVIEYFGMTEGMSHLLSNPLHGQQRPGTVGVPTKNVNAKIKEGRLYIQSQHAYTDQWFDTGDLAEQDSTGYFRILGRNIDQINVKGYKINPVSVENQLRHRFPQIKDCVVFGKTKLSCLYSGDVDIGVVKQALIQIHPLCQPKHIQNVTIIPIPQTGKISRTWLIEKFQVD